MDVSSICDVIKGHDKQQLGRVVRITASFPCQTRRRVDALEIVRNEPFFIASCEIAHAVHDRIEPGIL